MIIVAGEGQRASLAFLCPFFITFSPWIKVESTTPVIASESENGITIRETECLWYPRPRHQGPVERHLIGLHVSFIRKLTAAFGLGSRRLYFRGAGSFIS